MTGARGAAGGPVLLAALVFVVLATAVAAGWHASGEQVTDISLYHAYGERIVSGKVPYRDFRLEYPPGVIAVLALPALVTESRDAYRVVFGFWMAAWGVAGLVLVARARARLARPPGETRVVLWLAALSPLLLGQLLLDRFDLVPTTLSVAVVVALLHERTRLAALLLGAAIAVKLYPGVLLPLLVAWTWRRAGRASALRAGAITLGVVGVAYLPFLVIAPGGVAESLGRQLGRPLQIESLGAGVLLVVHQLTGMELTWRSASGSQNLTGVPAAVLAATLAIAQLAALAVVWARFARGRVTGDALAVSAAAAVVAFVALSKVLSPQFLIWPLFLLPLVSGLRLRVAGALYLAACLLTELWFPAHYWELVKQFDALSSWLVLARDLALLGLLAALLVPFRDEARARAPARSRSPAPSSGRT